MTGTAKPELAVNRAGHTVAEALNSFIGGPTTNRVGGAGVDIATAYFNVGGYALLADALDQATRTRLLLGAEPTPPEQRPRPLGKESHLPAKAARDRVRHAVTEHETHLLSDRDLLGFDREVDAQTRRLIDWLRSDTVEVRRLESRFLHGKAFLISAGDHGVIAGSSNLTAAGLTANAELNLGAYQPHTVQQVRQWYDELWDEAKDYDLASLFEARFEPHAPYLIFLRMLWERYADELDDEHEQDSEIRLTLFQTDGVWRAKRILDRWNGVLIADEVGLGKTFIAGEMIREAALDRRQRVLVVTPPHCAMVPGGGSGRSTTCRWNWSPSRSCWVTRGSIPAKPPAPNSQPGTSTSTRWWSSTRPTTCAILQRNAQTPCGGCWPDRPPSSWYCSPPPP